MKDWLCPNGEGGITYGAGMILEKDSQNDNYYRIDGNAVWSAMVESNSQWFSEVKEEKPFQWDDELVWDYATRYFENANYTIEQFKQSNPHTSSIPSGEEELKFAKPIDKSFDGPRINKYTIDEPCQWAKPKEEVKEPERIEVKGFSIAPAVPVLAEWANKLLWYNFGTNYQIPHSKQKLVAEAIEQVINNDINVMEHFYKCQSNNWEKEYKKLSEQVDKMILDAEQKAFDAARLIRPLPFDHQAYPTFSDYKNINHIKNK